MNAVNAGPSVLARQSSIGLKLFGPNPSHCPTSELPDICRGRETPRQSSDYLHGLRSQDHRKKCTGQGMCAKAACGFQRWAGIHRGFSSGGPYSVGQTDSQTFGEETQADVFREIGSWVGELILPARNCRKVAGGILSGQLFNTSEIENVKDNELYGSCNVGSL